MRKINDSILADLNDIFLDLVEDGFNVKISHHEIPGVFINTGKQYKNTISVNITHKEYYRTDKKLEKGKSGTSILDAMIRSRHYMETSQGTFSHNICYEIRVAGVIDYRELIEWKEK